MTVKEKVARTLETLSEAELGLVAEYMEFLKFRARMRAMPSLDTTEIGALYAQFAEQDRCLAEVGMAEYNAALQTEDKV